MQVKQQKSRRKKEKFPATVNESRKSLINGSIIATVIAATPYLFYLYESVPDTQIWSTFLFTYDSMSWESAQWAMWIFTGKAIPLLLLLIWFFTNRHWWFHVLLVPIIMYIYQILGIFNENTKYLDESQIIYFIPIMAIIIPSIYLIRAQIFNKINTANKSMQELEDEFKVSPKNFWDKVKNYF
ncbi:hypothetical protein [Litoribaculum gwangyangense]